MPRDTSCVWGFRLRAVALLADAINVESSSRLPMREPEGIRTKVTSLDDQLRPQREEVRRPLVPFAWSTTMVLDLSEGLDLHVQSSISPRVWRWILSHASGVEAWCSS